MNTICETALEQPEVQTIAIWKTRDGDHPVIIIGDLGVGPDGRQYVAVQDTLTGLPLDELELGGRSRTSKPLVGVEDGPSTFEPKERRPIWQYRITIPAAVSSITALMDQVRELGEETKCFAGKELEIETALREALANAIVHSCQNDERQTVQLSVSCHQDREIEMAVRNPGRGFDPRSIQDPQSTRISMSSRAAV